MTFRDLVADMARDTVERDPIFQRDDLDESLECIMGRPSSKNIEVPIGESCRKTGERRNEQVKTLLLLQSTDSYQSKSPIGVGDFRPRIPLGGVDGIGNHTNAMIRNESQCPTRLHCLNRNVVSVPIEQVAYCHSQAANVPSVGAGIDPLGGDDSEIKAGASHHRCHVANSRETDDDIGWRMNQSPPKSKGCANQASRPGTRRLGRDAAQLFQPYSRRERIKRYFLRWCKSNNSDVMTEVGQRTGKTR
jgi:hypothetical protein